jgi:hypothetical protein
VAARQCRAGVGFLATGWLGGWLPEEPMGGRKWPGEVGVPALGKSRALADCFFILDTVSLVDVWRRIVRGCQFVPGMREVLRECLE